MAWPSRTTASTSPWLPTARRASGRSRSSPHDGSSDVDVARRTRCAGSPATAAPSAWSRSTRTSSCSSGSPAPTTRLLLSDVTAADEWQLAGSARRALELPDARGRGRPGARPATSTCSPTSACARWTWACCSTTSTSTPTRCSSDVARRLGFGALFDDAVGLDLRLSAADGPWRTTRRCAPPSTRRAPRWRPATSRSGRSSSTPTATVVGRGPQRPRGRRRPDRPRRGRRAARRGRGRAASGGSTAAPWSSPSSRARCAPARSCWPASTGSCSARTTTKAGAVGSLWDVVRDRRLNHRPEVVAGVLADESTALLRRVLPRPPRLTRTGRVPEDAPGRVLRHTTQTSPGSMSGRPARG